MFVQQKIRSIAILKCVGGRSSQLLAIYMAQVIALGLRGQRRSACCSPALAIARDPVDAGRGRDAGHRWSTTRSRRRRSLQGFGIGLLVSVLFSLVPLLDIRHVKPSLLLRVGVGDAAAATACRSS